MEVKLLKIERFGEHIRVILLGRDVLHHHFTIGDELAYFEVSTLDVPRA